MIYLYISPSCQSCRKALKWFEEFNIPHKTFNIISQKLTKEDIFRMLKNTENGFEDIISERSIPFKELKVSIDEMKTSEVVEFIIEHPTVLKRPIIVSNDIVEIGYNADDIRAFIPPERRMFNNLFECDNCDEKESGTCPYNGDPAILASEMQNIFEK